MSTLIHPTALVDPKAKLGENVEIGPYCILGPHVQIGDNCRLHGQVQIMGHTEIGAECEIYPFAVLGAPPQDFKYANDPTRLIVGEKNIIREQVTFHIGTAFARGQTVIGSNSFFMVGAHVGHDCIVGDGVVFANNATLGGEVTVEDKVIMGGLSAIHQKCRVGKHAFIGGGAPVTGDVIPYGMVDNHGQLAGLNLVGLKRRGFGRDCIHDLRAAYRLIFALEGAFSERVEDAARIFAERPEVGEILAFIKAPAARPLCMPEK
ncbi:acyl-ACP--UDP-N-acetylglucosamine O-acyltransferase [Woodsholea maritima]|uniref:acyl-ACP--UDP-N-acetylglucosamine O-acyltransferase n=1 Tax=Woodsholea maritima TaxID=240237 RepID=UPI000382E9EE|nr:acyl-ACP--UDP-N-acetylglucosamine O-acyltransferase [Woodsholea maritima]